MADRVVLGGSSLARTVAGRLVDRPGGVCVVTDDESQVDTLVSDGIQVEAEDPTDVGVLQGLGQPSVVMVAGNDPDRNVAAARAAREVFPEAALIAYTGREGRGGNRDLARIADRVIDPAREAAEFLMKRVGDRKGRLRDIQRVLRSLDRLAVVTHDNPDPDAIGSAVALSRLAERAGCDADVCHYGEINHQENRAFVNLLEFELRNLGPDSDLDEYDGFALVDHSRPGVNDQLPEDLPVDIVIDHHPPRAPVEARFVDLRSEVGATSTLLVDYFDHFGVTPTEDIATGLLFGIRIDTKEFTRETSQADFEAAATLVPHADLGMLERVESPSISPSTFGTIADAIRNRNQEGAVVLSCVGRLSDRDALAQAADRLLELAGVTTTVVYGVCEGTIYVSARSRGTDIDLGETLRDAFGAIGSAGGHADMAGAQITLGVLEATEDLDASLQEVVEAVITDRFFDALSAHSSQTMPGVYVTDHDAEKFLVDGAESTGSGDDAYAPSDSPEGSS